MTATPQTRTQFRQLMEFVLVENHAYKASWTFFIPPESYEQSEPVRKNTVRTLSGGYSDLFGPDLPQITIEGTTGYGIRTFQNGQEVDGNHYWLQFLQTIERIFASGPLDNPNVDYGLHLYNWTHQQYYDVMVDACTWDMAVPESIVYYYHLELTALQPLLRPHTPGYSVSYSNILINNTTNFRSVAQGGAMHSAMVQTLLGIG